VGKALDENKECAKLLAMLRITSHYMPLFRRIALVMTVSVLVSSAQAATYFVATNGLDTNLGTDLAAPCQTIQHTSGKLVAGDTLLIRGGVYHEMVIPAGSGTSTAPITFAAYSNEVVTIDAASPVTGWTLVSNGIYKAPAPWDLGMGNNQIFVDGTMIHQAQTPNPNGSDVMHPGVASVSNDPLNPNVITSAAFSGKPDNYFAGAWFVGGVGDSWAWQSARVISSTGSSVTVDPATETPSWWFTGNGSGFLFGLSNMLDADNEWHLQTNSTGNSLYLRITGGADPTTHLVERKQRLWCVNYNSRSYISVRNLNLFGGAVNMSGNSNVLENCHAQYLSHYMIITDGFLENGGVQQGGGVVVNGIGNTVRGCNISSTAGSGIFTSGTSNFITRNTIFNTDYSGTYASSIALHGNVDIVTFNTAFASGRDILRPEGIGADIRFNDLSNPGLLAKDLGVIYCWGINGQGVNGQPTRIAYNWIHDNNHINPAPLVYLDDWDANYQIDHNVIWNSGGDAGVRINGPAAAIRVYNNTLYNCAPVGANSIDTWPNSNPNPSYWTSDINQYSSSNNLYFPGSPQAQLPNFSNRDFRLKNNAPAIDAGVNIPGITDGFIGTAPDLGAYEFGAPTWTPGAGSKLSMTFTNMGPEGLKLMASPDAAYYRLFSATSLNPDATWILVTNSPAVSGSLWSLTLPATTNSAAYYRLQSQ
jgi:hypothetical protein